MSTLTHVPNVPQITDDAADPGLRDVIERAKVTKSPPPAWYRTMGQNPDVAKEFARYWDMLHRGGTVPHRDQGTRAHPDRPDRGLRILRAADFSAGLLHHRRGEDRLRFAELGASRPEDSRRPALRAHAHAR